MFTSNKIPGGAIHALPADLRKAVSSDTAVTATWYDITPLARNEWICWIESAKQTETRDRRVRVALSKMRAGTRRPCCWVGCMHRQRNGR